MSTSRAVRAGRLGRVTLGQSARRAALRVGGLVMTDERRRIRLDAEAQRGAADLVRVLGSMKGAAMKIGQILSLLDLSVVDRAHRDEFRARLADLQAAGDPVDFEAMRPRIEADLGRPVAEAFAEFEPEPFASASIGQVHRARLHDGRTVAVKVQYPGVAAAVRADLKNLALFLRMSRGLAPTISAEGFIEELQTQFAAELDDAREERTQRALAERYGGHPFIHVPRTVPECCGPGTLTTEYIEGAAMAEVAEMDEEVRDRVGEIIYRFYPGSLYRDHAFNGDPHPGNMILMPDGRVAFIDFGMYKTMRADAVGMELRCLRAAADGDAAQLRREFEALGVVGADSAVTADECLEYVLDATWWNLVDEPVRVDPADVSSAVVAVTFPNSDTFRAMRSENFPPEHVFSRRLDFLAFGTLGSIRAGGNWYRIGAEWLYGDPPATALGEAEAAWRAGAGQR